MDRYGKRRRVNNPSAAAQIGHDHGQATGRTIDRLAVERWSPGWTEQEVDAYLAARAKAVKGD